MIGALSPALSWLIFGALIVAALLIYAYIEGSARFNEMERRAHESWTFTEPADPQLRIFGGVYDHEVRGDFEPQSELPEMGHPELRGGRP